MSGQKKGGDTWIKIFCSADKRGMKDFLTQGTEVPGGMGAAASWEMPGTVYRNPHKQTAPAWHSGQPAWQPGVPGGDGLSPLQPVWPGGFNESSSHIKNTLSP